MKCVDGGAFLLGSPTFIPTANAYEPSPERVVRVSPFALDIDELTVGEFRTIAKSLSARPTRRGPDPETGAGACTFVGDDNPANDALPLNCASFDLAVSICAALGKRLPTEAEWEWAAGNGPRETTYPWRDDDDLCARAIVGRGRTVFETVETEFATCRTAADGKVLPWGPVAGGSPSDITPAGIHNLGGNVAEWVDGGFDAYAAPCWRPEERVLVDPKCAVTDAANREMRAVRGGHWAAPGHFARVYNRSAARTSVVEPPIIGVRCAKSTS